MFLSVTAARRTAADRCPLRGIRAHSGSVRALTAAPFLLRWGGFGSSLSSDRMMRGYTRNVRRATPEDEVERTLVGGRVTGRATGSHRGSAGRWGGWF